MQKKRRKPSTSRQIQERAKQMDNVTLRAAFSLILCPQSFFFNALPGTQELAQKSSFAIETLADT